MNRKTILTALLIIFCLLIARNSGAVISIDYVSGLMYSEAGANFSADEVLSSSGANSSASVIVDQLVTGGVGGYAYANGTKDVGPGGLNHAVWTLSSQAQTLQYSSSGSAFSAYSLNRSGVNAGDMLEYVLTPTAGETEELRVTARSLLAGTLNSGGMTCMNPLMESGIATVDFIFSVYANPADAPLMSFDHDDIFQNTPPATQLEVGTSLPGPLGELYVDGFFPGDHIWVQYEQLCTATSPVDAFSSAKAFFVQSVNEMELDATPVPQPVPEPATFLLLGIGIFGFGLFDKKRKNQDK